MPKTKKENLIFALIMCIFMCIIMSAYNMFIHNGLSYETLIIWLKSIIPTFIIAFTVSYFIVNPNAKKISFKIAKKNPKHIGTLIAFFMVCGMVLIMALYGTIMGGGLNNHFILNYLINIGTSFIFALPLQLFIVGPIVRTIFAKVKGFIPNNVQTENA